MAPGRTAACVANPRPADWTDAQAASLRPAYLGGDPLRHISNAPQILTGVVPHAGRRLLLRGSSTSRRNIDRYFLSRESVSRTVPSEGSLKAAAELLNGSSKIAILAGQGALGATIELIAVAENLGAPISKTVAKDKIREMV